MQAFSFRTILFFYFFSTALLFSAALKTSEQSKGLIVTASDYCDFLNSVSAKSAPDFLYNEKMSYDLYTGAIVRVDVSEGTSVLASGCGGYKYFVIAGRENWPITFVNQNDEQAYCTWAGVSIADSEENSTRYLLPTTHYSASFANGSCDFSVEITSLSTLSMEVTSIASSSSSSSYVKDAIGAVTFLGLASFAGINMMEEGRTGTPERASEHQLPFLPKPEDANIDESKAVASSISIEDERPLVLVDFDASNNYPSKLRRRYSGKRLKAGEGNLSDWINQIERILPFDIANSDEWLQDAYQIIGKAKDTWKSFELAEKQAASQRVRLSEAESALTLAEEVLEKAERKVETYKQGLERKTGATDHNKKPERRFDLLYRTALREREWAGIAKEARKREVDLFSAEATSIADTAALFLDKDVKHAFSSFDSDEIITNMHSKICEIAQGALKGTSSELDAAVVSVLKELLEDSNNEKMEIFEKLYEEKIKAINSILEYMGEYISKGSLDDWDWDLVTSKEKLSQVRDSIENARSFKAAYLKARQVKEHSLNAELQVHDEWIRNHDLKEEKGIQYLLATEEEAVEQAVKDEISKELEGFREIEGSLTGHREVMAYAEKKLQELADVTGAEKEVNQLYDATRERKNNITRQKFEALYAEIRLIEVTSGILRCYYELQSANIEHVRFISDSWARASEAATLMRTAWEKMNESVTSYQESKLHWGRRVIQLLATFQTTSARPSLDFIQAVKKIDADLLGELWVGNNFHFIEKNNLIALESEDELRRYRLPSWKHAFAKAKANKKPCQANYEWRFSSDNAWSGGEDNNVHLNIDDIISKDEATDYKKLWIAHYRQFSR